MYEKESMESLQQQMRLKKEFDSSQKLKTSVVNKPAYINLEASNNSYDFKDYILDSTKRPLDEDQNDQFQSVSEVGHEEPDIPQYKTRDTHEVSNLQNNLRRKTFE